jgi:hypothetical protein
MSDEMTDDTTTDEGEEKKPVEGADTTEEAV